jgi:mitogen-activated protein kinase 1/3
MQSKQSVRSGGFGLH